MVGTTGEKRIIRVLALASVGILAMTLGACSTTTSSDSSSAEIKIGFITKSTTNPFFVKEETAAKAAAKKLGAEIISLSGDFDGDNEGQVQAIENLVSKGVKGIIIDPSSSGGILAAIDQARSAGIVVVAIDTETDPLDAVDATFATDNTDAGRQVGAYVRAKLGSTAPQLALLDLQPGATVGEQRHDGFLAGFGASGPKDPMVVGSGITNGAQDIGQQVMENLLQRNSKINSVYAINEPAALGAVEAIEQAGLTGKILIGTIDGGCTGVQNVKDGKIAATVMQFPSIMSEKAVNAIVAKVRDNTELPKGFNDTGAVLITDAPVAGLESKDTAWGLENCWG